MAGASAGSSTRSVMNGKSGSPSVLGRQPYTRPASSRGGLLAVSESDGFAEQQDGAAPGVRFRVEDEKAVDGAGLPVGHLGTGAFQREGVVFDAAQRGAQVGYHLLRPDDPDRAGAAAGVGGQLASAGRGDHQGAGFGERGDAAHDDVGAGDQP